MFSMTQISTTHHFSSSKLRQMAFFTVNKIHTTIKGNTIPPNYCEQKQDDQKSIIMLDSEGIFASRLDL